MFTLDQLSFGYKIQCVKTYLLEGTYSLNESLNPNAWLSAAKMIKEGEKVDRECILGDNRCSCNESEIHERNIRVLIPTLPHSHCVRATG